MRLAVEERWRVGWRRQRGRRTIGGERDRRITLACLVPDTAPRCHTAGSAPSYQVESGLRLFLHQPRAVPSPGPWPERPPTRARGLSGPAEAPLPLPSRLWNPAVAPGPLEDAVGPHPGALGGLDLWLLAPERPRSAPTA